MTDRRRAWRRDRQLDPTHHACRDGVDAFGEREDAAQDLARLQGRDVATRVGDLGEPLLDDGDRVDLRHGQRCDGGTLDDPADVALVVGDRDGCQRTPTALALVALAGQPDLRGGIDPGLVVELGGPSGALPFRSGDLGTEGPGRSGPRAPSRGRLPRMLRRSL